MSIDSAEKRAAKIAGEYNNQAYKRFLHAIVIVCIAGLVLLCIRLYYQQQQRWLAHDTDEPGEVLARHYATLLAPALTGQDDIMLQRAIDTLEAEPAVIQATVFNAQGRQRASDYPVAPLSEAMRNSERGLVVHLSDIKNDSGSVTGYLRIVSAPPPSVFLPARGGIDMVMIGAIIAIIAFIAGIYITRSFYKLRPFIIRRYQILSRRWSGPQ